MLNCLQAIVACAVAAAYMAYLGWNKKSSMDVKKVDNKSKKGMKKKSGNDEKDKKDINTNTNTISGLSITKSLLKDYFIVGFFNTIASPFGYASLRHIDYPTMILGKSCKLVPVLIMSSIVYRKKYPWYKYLSVALITIGVSGFMLMHDPDVPTSSSSKKARTNSLYGLALLTINLAIDGFTNSSQDKIFHTYKGVSGTHMMFYMNFCSALYMIAYLLSPFTTELWDALTFIHTFPQVLQDVFLFSLAGGIGQIFIFHTLAKFGSMALVTVTVTRKLFTILLSVFWFGHVMGGWQWVSVAVVFGGIGVEAFMKSGDKSKVKVKVKSKVVSKVEKEEKKFVGENGNGNGQGVNENGGLRRRRSPSTSSSASTSTLASTKSRYVVEGEVGDEEIVKLESEVKVTKKSSVRRKKK